MDLRILEIASNTENNKILDKHTHKSKNKNPMCGDEMEISLLIKDNKVMDMGYQCKSCVYCQASVSLLSQNIKDKNLEEIKDLVNTCEDIFENTKIILERKFKRTQILSQNANWTSIMRMNIMPRTIVSPRITQRAG